MCVVKFTYSNKITETFFLSDIHISATTLYTKSCKEDKHFSNKHFLCFRSSKFNERLETASNNSCFTKYVYKSSALFILDRYVDFVLIRRLWLKITIAHVTGNLLGFIVNDLYYVARFRAHLLLLIRFKKYNITPQQKLLTFL